MAKESLISSKVCIIKSSNHLRSHRSHHPQQNLIQLSSPCKTINIQKAMDNIAQPIVVQLYVRSKLNQQQYDENIYKLERIWENQTSEELRVDQKTFSKSEYEAFVESLGFSYSNSYNIIQQGKVNQVITMDQFDIYKLLEEATGMKKYEKRLQQALGYMKKNQEQKEEIKNILNEVETRLQVYQSRKQQFQYYNLEEKACKLKSKAQCQSLINKFRKEILQFKEKESVSSDQITKLKIKVKDIQNQIEQMNSDITVNQKQIYQHFDQSTIDDELHISANLTQDQKQNASKIKKIKNNKDKLKKELQKMSKEVQKVNNEMKNFKEKYEFFTSLIDTQKMAKLGKEKSSQQLQRFIKKSQQNIKQIENQLKKIQKMKSQYKIPTNIFEKNEILAKKQLLNQILYELKGNKIKFFEASRNKNQFESQVEVYTQQISVCYAKMRKVLPLLQFNVLNQLKKQNVKGVYGFLIQFVEIEPNVMFAYQMTGLNKLCTLIVQNQQVCQIVVNLIKKLKCKQINILPLSFLKKQPVIKKSLPNIDDCYSLLNQDWIKVKSHSFGQQFTRSIEKIMINTFNNQMLVKEYELGLKISKQYHLNCITADKEIIYSQGYLCKLGKDLNVDDKLQSFFKYAQKNLALEQSSKKLSMASQDVLVLQNKEIELMTKKAGLQSQIRNLQIKIDVINEKKLSLGKLEQEEETLTNKKLKYEQEIARKQQILANYDKKIQTKINMTEFKEIQQMYNNKLKLYNQKSEQQSELERKLSQILKQEQVIHQQMKNITGQISFQKQFNVSFVGGKQYKQKLQKQNDELRTKKQKLEKQLMNLTQILSEKQTQNYHYLGNITILQEQTEFYREKIDQIGTLNITLQEVQQQSNSFSMSFNRLDDKRKIRIYTTLERLMFSKIQGYIQKHKQFLSKFQELQRCQKQINQMISKFQIQKNQSVNKVFQNFQKQFDKIFKAITLHGKTDIRLKKVNDKTRGIIKIKNSISIMVSFQGERQMTKKWSEFSGGQKTVIAICLLMALQKCQPAPFYILDQIDSALDSVYLERIVNLIRRESAHSQYFISSFKPQMLQFSEQHCNYYLVENIDRVSNLKRISQQEAKRTIDRIMVN